MLTVTQSSRRRTGIALAALAGAAALVVVFALSRATHEATATPVVAPPVPTATATTAAPAATRTAAIASAPAAAAAGDVIAAPASPAPSIDDVMQAQASGAIDVLVAGLSATDAVVVAESANGLVARGALSAIPSLVELDVVARPWAAPSVIYAMGRLAALASDEERGLAVERLLALLAAEKERNSPEALANLLHIYEALGHTGDARAIAPLEHELADRRVATAPKVVVVQALVQLGARQSKPALERALVELAPTLVGDDFEAAVRRDLEAAIREALVQLT
ncbi:MAG: hypothetical protein AB7T06_47770 [Kofleriaceae bacterium]